MALTSLSIVLIIVSTIFPLLSGVLVTLRIRARKVRKYGIGADDWWVIAALIITTAGTAVYIVGACIGGVGTHVEDVGFNTFVINGKITFANQFFYIFSVAPIKISVLFFYRRVFGVSTAFRKVTSGMFALVGAWTVAFFFATLFQAWPISYNWSGVGTATNYIDMYYALSGSNIGIDLITVCLPMPMIKSLRLSTSKKVQIMGIFSLGAFCVVSSAIHLYYLALIANPALVTDPTYQTANILIWSSIEPCASIIAACLPTLGPLFASGRTAESMVRSVRSVRSLFSGSKSTLSASAERVSSHESNVTPKDLEKEHAIPASFAGPDC